MPKLKHKGQKGYCRVCGNPISGKGRLYCEDCHLPKSLGGGYVAIYAPDHPRANGSGYVYEHIVIMEKKLGRSLKPDEVVHHIDENRSNNVLDNLQVLSIRAHRAHHSALRRQEIANELKQIARDEWVHCWYDPGLCDSKFTYLRKQGYSLRTCQKAANMICRTYMKLTGGWQKRARENEAAFLEAVEEFVSSEGSV